MSIHPIYSFDDVHDTQKIFRIMLDSMARPGKINVLPSIYLLRKDENFLYLIAKTLLDIEVTFCFLPQNNFLEYQIKQDTGSSTAPIDKADYIFCDGRKENKNLYLAKQGSLFFLNKVRPSLC